jgi:hypothetical protein
MNFWAKRLFMDHLSGIDCADQKIHCLLTLKKGTAMKLKRRSVLKGMLASSVGISALKMPALAEQAPFKIGLLTVKSGPLTEGGVQMEQGIMAVQTVDCPASVGTKSSDLIYW